MKHLIRFLQVNGIDYMMGNEIDTIILPELDLYIYENGDGSYTLYDCASQEYDMVPGCAALCHAIRRYDDYDIKV